MPKNLVLAALRKVLPVLLGAVGAYLATAFPGVYAAFCTGAR